MAEWRVIRGGDTLEPDLYDVEVADTANPFGNYAIAYIDDNEGEKFDDYSRGTRVDFQVEEFGATTVGYGESYGTSYGTGMATRFTGFVVEARELDREGRDSLEVECYSFDQFLRRTTVTNDQTGNTITEALEDIVTIDTPVDWVAGNVTVADDQTLTRSYRGERVENVLKSLASKSGSEEFGVNGNLEFFFRPRESSHASRDIDNTQWLNYDIPEEGKSAVNEVTVYYDGGDKSVTVDDGSDKLELQDSLGTRTPVALSEEVTREDITDIDDARSVAEQILNGREATLTGTVTTYGLLDTQPGDIINIQIDPRGIDGDFRIAEVEYRWGPDETILTIVEKRGDQDDILVNLSDSVKRVEMREANRDAVGNKITSTSAGAVITPTGDVDGTSFDAARVTNLARNKLRDAWAGGSTVSITEIAVGNDASAPSRADTALGNELERVAVSESLPSSTSVLYEGTVSTTDIREVGLFDAGGDLIARATIPDTTLSSTVALDFTLTVSNDPAVENGVLTRTGQTAVRDILADNSPGLPTQYAYGSSAGAPAESDTALGSQEISVPLDEVLVQSAASATDWPDLADITATEPVEITATGEFELQASANTLDTTADYSDRDISNTPLGDEYNSGGTSQLVAAGEFLEFEVSFPYDLPRSRLGIQVRDETDAASDISFIWDGTEFDNNVGDSFALGWTDIGAGFYSGTGIGSVADETLEAGETHTLRIKANASSDYSVDVVCVYDTDYTYTFSNPGTENNGGILDGPETHPNVHEFEFTTATTRRQLDEARAEQSWDDTSGGQYIELSNDGGGTWHTTTNSQTASATFASSSTQVTTRVGLSRYGSGGSTIPATGFNGQSITAHDLHANVASITAADIGVADVRAIIAPNTITGTTLREAGQLDSGDGLLTHCIFAEFDVLSNQRVISSESVTWRNP